MNFAPYQSSPPENTRVATPPPRTSTASPNTHYTKPQPSIADTSDPWGAARLPSPDQYNDNEYTDLEGQGQGQSRSFLGAAPATDVFATSLGFRMEIEACLAYLMLPPAGGVILLIFEHKSDYVRFHAWQSALVFTALFVIHLIFSWSSALSWILFVVDLGLIAFLTFRAYKDAEVLERIELPFFGPLASRFVDSE